MQDQFLRDGVAMFDRITLALVGIGALEPSRLLASSGNVFSRKELTDLKKRGAVGDLVLRFFDRHGKPVDSPLDDRVIGIDLERLRKVDRVVGDCGRGLEDASDPGGAGRWLAGYSDYRHF